MFKQKWQLSDQGFTLIEVVVSILIMTVFVTITMQGMVIAALLKVRAREYSEAIALIQKDLENVKQQATILSMPSTTLASAISLPTLTTLDVASATNLAATTGTKLMIGTDAVSNVVATVVNNIITINNPGVGTTLASGATVTNIDMCTATTASAGFAYKLATKLSPTLTLSGTNGTKTSPPLAVGNRSYELRLDTAVSSSAPHKILQLTYTVKLINTSNNTSSERARIYTEVIPDAAFKCPQ